MKIVKTPVRISLFGGGTDYPEYFKKKEGITINMAIDKYSYLILHENENDINKSFLFSYKKLEKVKKINSIKHKSINSCLKYFKIKNFIELHYTSDLPAKTGLGSSSSFTVGLVNALSKMKNYKWSNFEIAKKAIYIEQKLNKERVGCQDQISCAMGGFNLTRYTKKQIINKKIKINKNRFDKLISNLLLFYTGKTRFADKILMEQTKRNKIGKNDSTLDEIKKKTLEALDVLINQKINLTKFGELLNDTWILKKKLSSKISNKFIDKYYDLALNSGATGGKILGAGSGGFMLFYVPKKNQKRVIKSLSDLKLIKFKLDNFGTKIISE